MTATETIEQQLEVLRAGAGIFPTSDSGFLRITGPDATRWLNGMVTNSIQALQPGEGNYNFLLNAQGRIQGDCTIYREPGEGEPTFLLQTDRSQVETIHQVLDRFIIMDDVELTPAYEDKSALVLLGTEAPAMLASLGFSPIESGRMEQILGFDGALVFRTTGTLLGLPRCWFYSSEAGVAELREALGGNVPEISSGTIEALRILESRPGFGKDIRERDLPQETAQTHALHFAKGCYLGQEIVERIRSRGQVHRTFTAFTLTGELPPVPAPLEANGKAAGELTSAMRIGDLIHALGYARREFLESGATLSYQGGTAEAKSSR